MWNRYDSFTSKTEIKNLRSAGRTVLRVLLHRQPHTSPHSKERGSMQETSEPKFNEQESSLKDGTRAGQTRPPSGPDERKPLARPTRKQTPKDLLEARHSSLLWHCLPTHVSKANRSENRSSWETQIQQVKSDTLGLKERESSRTLTVRRKHNMKQNMKSELVRAKDFHTAI